MFQSKSENSSVNTVVKALLIILVSRIMSIFIQEKNLTSAKLAMLLLLIEPIKLLMNEATWV